MVRQELLNPISEVGADKFILYPLLTVLDQSEILSAVTSHIKGLEKKKSEIKGWLHASYFYESALSPAKKAFAAIVRAVIDWICSRMLSIEPK